MRSRTSTWFECKIRYEKTMEDGSQKKVTELYVVDALSFTEAEASIIEEMSSYISGEFEVKDIKKAAYGEIFFSDSPFALPPEHATVIAPFISSVNRRVLKFMKE